MYVLYMGQIVMVFCVEGDKVFVYEGVVEIMIYIMDFLLLFDICIKVMFNFVNFVVVY